MVETSCPSRDDTEGIPLVVSEQTKHTGIPFLCYEDLLISSGIRDIRHQSFSASTQPSQTRHARPKMMDFMGASDHKWKERSTDISLLISIHTIHRAFKRALSKKMNVVMTFVFRR